MKAPTTPFIETLPTAGAPRSRGIVRSRKRPPEPFATNWAFRDRDRLPESRPSARGELEITALNQLYLDQAQLHVQITGRGIGWFDTGAQESLLKAAAFVQTIEERQGTMIACLEEITLRHGWIDSSLLQTQRSDGHKPLH